MPAPSAEHGAVALLGKREAALGREHVHRLPGLHGAVADDALRCPDDGHVDKPMADVVAADADGVRGRRAGAAGGERRPLDPVFDADVGRSRGADDAQQRQRMRGALVADEEIAIGRLHGHQTARARSNDAGRAVGLVEGHLEARLPHGFVGRGRGKPRIAVGIQDDLVALEVLELGLVVEILDLGRDQDLEVFEGKAAELADAELALPAPGPEIGDRGADRGHDARAGDDDAPRHGRFCHVALVSVCIVVATLGAAADRPFKPWPVPPPMPRSDCARDRQRTPPS